MHHQQTKTIKKKYFQRSKDSKLLENLQKDYENLQAEYSLLNEKYLSAIIKIEQFEKKKTVVSVACTKMPLHIGNLKTVQHFATAVCKTFTGVRFII